MVINSIYLCVAIVHSVVPDCVIDTVQVWTDHDIVLAGAAHGRIGCQTEQEVGFGSRKDMRLLQKSYQVPLVAGCNWFERSNEYLQSELLKLIFNHALFFIGLRHVLAAICTLGATFQQVHMKVILVNNL